jgi:hypothetical protein
VIWSADYLDISSGHRALSAALLTGVVATHIANHLADALEARDALVESVISATTRQKCDEAHVRRVESEQAYRASFRPHLQVQNRARSAFADFCGGSADGRSAAHRPLAR